MSGVGHPTGLDYVYCPVCAGKRLVETPECLDGHGADCPDRACIECGTAFYLDAVTVGIAVAARSGSPTSRVA